MRERSAPGGASGTAVGGAPEARGAVPFRFGRREALVSILFWSLFAAATAAAFLSNDHEPVGERRAIPELIYWFVHSYIWAAATPLVFRLFWGVGTPQGRRAGRIVLLVLAGVGLTLMVSLLQGAAWALLMGTPVDPTHDPTGLSGAFRRLDDEAITCAGVILVGILREQLLRTRDREEQAIRLQARASESDARAANLQAQLASARLALLRSQLNPHFLFNSLNALSTLVDDDPAGAQRMIARLSELLRYALEAREEEEIPIERELRLTQRYLDILEIRYAGRLTTRVELEAGARGALVPNLILQPLVENAMKHGVGRAGGRGSIGVEARRGGETLVLSVRDTGGGGAGAAGGGGPEGNGTGLGLQSTRARLQELYGTAQQLRLEPAPEGGTIAEISLPFRPAPPGAESSGTVRAGEGAHA